MANRFDLSPEALVAELEMAACCGVPPYSPDQLLEIIVTDETVSTRVGTALARPRRLSPREGLALAASARALVAVPGSDEDGALSRALAKLERALGRARRSTSSSTRPDLLDAVTRRRSVRVSPWPSPTTRPPPTRRASGRSSPRHLFASEGHWYVDAWCDSVDGVRRFRVDRIASAAPAGPAEPIAWTDGPPDTRSSGAAVGGDTTRTGNRRRSSRDRTAVGSA